MRTPIIGITTYNDLNLQGFPAVLVLRAYVNAIINAGGTPVLIPSGIPQGSSTELLDRLDGVLFTGGGDISIDRYNGIAHPSLYNVDEQRDELEFQLIRAAIENDKPFLGICRGLQLLNVVLGGSLYSDIAAQKPDSIKHDYYPDIPRQFIAHQIQVLSDSKLGRILGSTTLEVNSLHHQGIMNVASQLNPVGFAPDRLVEAIELPGHTFGIAVQWHPEWLTDQEHSRYLFSSFVNASATR